MLFASHLRACILFDYVDMFALEGLTCVCCKQFIYSYVLVASAPFWHAFHFFLLLATFPGRNLVVGNVSAAEYHLHPSHRRILILAIRPRSVT